MSPNPVLLEALEVLTVGLPFCIFKVLGGLLLGKWGIPLLLLGGADALLNAVNLLSLAALRRRLAPKCTLLPILRRLLPPGVHTEAEMAAALDVALSFLIVAVVIGGGFLSRLAPSEVRAWSFAVVLNVIGAGLFQVTQAYAKVRAGESR